MLARARLRSFFRLTPFSLTLALLLVNAAILVFVLHGTGAVGLGCAEEELDRLKAVSTATTASKQVLPYSFCDTCGPEDTLCTQYGYVQCLL